MTETSKRVEVAVVPQYRRISLAQPPRLIGASVGLEARLLGAVINLDALPVRVIGHIDWYEGEYEVDPRFVEQNLDTQNKGMHRDVEVHAIRVAAVENPQGGNTVWIGKE